MKPVLKSYPKGGLPDSSIHALRILNEKDLARVRDGKEFPKKIFADVELSEREPVKCIDVPTSFDQMTTLVFVRPGTKPFAFHEGLRKGFTFDSGRTETLALDLSALSAADQVRALDAVATLLVLGAYEPTTFGEKSKKKPKKKTAPEVLLRASLSSAKASEIFELALSAGESANLVRLLADLPANELRPAGYLERIRKLGREWGVHVEFFDQKALAKRGANAFLAVARAEPSEIYGIVKLVYKPKGKSSGRKVALVGKGICFDTGGYNIKGGEYMLDMHRDMTGSAVALSLLGHLVRSGSNDEIEVYLALAENLISASAYRPNEVVTASNGVSIEVVDTDAEGRMVLCDTLVLANEGKPDLIIDYATLTGAVIRAIDTRRSGVFSNSDELRELAVSAGDAVGERVWGFPVGDDYWDSIQSDIADLRQCAVTNNADHIYAATFLSRFVKPETPWLHIDLASESHKGGLGLSAKDVTGFGIRLTDEILRRFKPKANRSKGQKRK